MDAKPLEPLTRDNLEACRQILHPLGRVVVAFSAGVDSSLLLAIAAQMLGKVNVLAAIGVSASLPKRELESGRALAAKLGIELAEVATGELEDARYAANPANRCYFCKGDLFRRLIDLAHERGFDVVISGANADDAGDFRPGLQAGKELGVRNPLMEAGLTKLQVREISRSLGLPTADKPAMACLASRIPYGQAITAQSLGRVEAAENLLRDLGFIQCRIRAHDTVARIEVPVKDFESFLASREKILQGLKKAGFTYIALDLQGLRSGSMNEMLPQ